MGISNQSIVHVSYLPISAACFRPDVKREHTLNEIRLLARELILNASQVQSLALVLIEGPSFCIMAMEDAHAWRDLFPSSGAVLLRSRSPLAPRP
jgi:hypothetical protein